ncbi:MAG: hypothetical protein JNL21_01685 [Myxococcales bacterium]|nr:hypothetical protein [Myxococcales bacterium]
MKLIPSEVIALYLVGAGFIQPDQPWVLLGWAVFGLFAVVLVRARGTTNPETGEGPQWAAVAISATSYVLWLYSLGGPFAAFPGHDLHEPAIASLLVLAWTFVVPYFYRG